jgi:molybdenum cofactor cytidylyltransferase
MPVVRQIAPERGQLDSFLLGWAASDEEAPWVMSCPVDHPYVKRATLESLIRATEEYPDAQMWSPDYRGRGGHPVIFASSLIPELRTHVHEGARPVVQTLGEKRLRLDVDDPGVLWDVDTPQDYQKFGPLYINRVRA